MRLPTSYNTGLYAQGKLSPVHPYLPSLDAGQAVPRALAQFGQQLEATLAHDRKLELDETMRQQTADFKQQLATTEADLLKRKEDLDNDTSIAEADKAKRFSEYAQAKQQELFTDAPQHIQQNYQAAYTGLVTPIAQQVQNNAQAAQTMTATKNVAAVTEKASADIEAIAKSGGDVSGRQKLFDEYLQQLVAGIDLQGVSAKDRERILGNAQLQAQKLFETTLFKQTQAEALAQTDDAIQTLVNSRAAINDPESVASQVQQLIGAGGQAAGFDGNQIRDWQQKEVSKVWQNAARGLFNDADQPNASLSRKVALDKALLQNLTATDEHGNYTWGGSDFRLGDRQGIIQMVQNRIEGNQDKIRAEALAAARAASGRTVSAFENMVDPLSARASDAGIKLVPIDMRNPSAALAARSKQAQQLGVSAILTKKEVELLANNFLKMSSPKEAFSWLGGLVMSAPPEQARTTLNMMSGQLQSASPVVSRAVGMYANGYTQQAQAYWEGKELMRVDGSNPALEREYKARTTETRTKLKGLLPDDAVENVADVVGVLVSTKGVTFDDAVKSLVGETRTVGRWRPTVPNQKIIVPPGTDPDRVTNWFNNPDMKTLKALGLDKQTVQQSKIVFRDDGYYLMNGPDFVPAADGRPARIPYDLFRGR